ncbi:MAG: DUF3883 domain-containing protein [Clostridia bacterium]|nr:DUF3883 domain-containing protein [Clostridia bacterium]
MRLADIQIGQVLSGIIPKEPVTVVQVRPFGPEAIELTYKKVDGSVHNELLYSDRESALQLEQSHTPWSFSGDGGLFKLVAEACRINLAHLFDLHLAVHTSLIEPLPHQITAVYEEMLNRHPLRYLLADDPGAGKTIMAGLFIKELIIRGDLSRCLIVTPGNLCEQWQDELSQKFNLAFEIMTNDRLESARTGNAFQETPLCIARLDKLARDDDVQQKLKATDWDLIVCDEAHKMSATVYGNNTTYTKRYKLGQLLSTITRHFLLLTATPHNGKEADFQLFMALLDADRFEGKYRPNHHQSDVSDLMRRVVKEDLVKFDGRPLFPERLAYTVNYVLSDKEAQLYKAVTDYVREEFNRAERLQNDKRKGTVGFALTILQRRLASSPEAIYQSLRRRRIRLERRLKEEKLLKREIDLTENDHAIQLNIEIDDLDDVPYTELEEIENNLIDQATAARTIAELEAEIQTLSHLVDLAADLRLSGEDRKWEELSHLLQDDSRMFDQKHTREKLIIFTEHKDTLDYLTGRIQSLLGDPDAVVNLHGGMRRDDRRKVQEQFAQDATTRILVATDAAGEGINLQRAHLMINYDLPWNPNRLEQRFGRIHRIGQTEVCHMWNLVAAETREGYVFKRLLDKLEQERIALGGRVFDVLGKMTYEDMPLRDLLIDAIRYGEQPEVRARLDQTITNALDTEKIRQLLDNKALARENMDLQKVEQIREDMERINAKRLQPHFIEAFFIEGFCKLGGSIYKREANRYEIKHIPKSIRIQAQMDQATKPLARSYERVCFEKDFITLPDKPLASLICPGHPLLESVISLLLEKYRGVLREGAILIDETNKTQDPRLLVIFKNAIQDGRKDSQGNRLFISQRMHFVEMTADGRAINAGDAPYLNYRPVKDEEKEKVLQIKKQTEWLNEDLEQKAEQYAVQYLIPPHLNEVRERKYKQIEKVEAAVYDRLTREINHWDAKAEELKVQEQAGKVNAKLNSELARRRADELAERRDRRLMELEQEKKLSPLPPAMIGCAFIIPSHMITDQKQESDKLTQETREIERIAMETVMKHELSLGFIPVDVSAENIGYDIESKKDGHLRLIEVKGRRQGTTHVTLTKNEIYKALNVPDHYILAIVEIDENQRTLTYIQKAFHQPPDFHASSVTYPIDKLMTIGTLIDRKEYS